MGDDNNKIKSNEQHNIYKKTIICLPSCRLLIQLYSFLFINLFILLIFIDTLYYLVVLIEFDQLLSILFFIKDQLEFIVMERVLGYVVLIDGGEVGWRGKDGVYCDSIDRRKHT